MSSDQQIIAQLTASVLQLTQMCHRLQNRVDELERRRPRRVARPVVQPEAIDDFTLIPGPDEDVGPVSVSAKDSALAASKESEVATLQVADDEMMSMFVEEEKKNARTVEETLNVGKKCGAEPVSYFAKPGAGYVTVGEADQASKKSQAFKKLSRTDELDIMRTFETIKGMNFFQAMGVVEEQGYSLHVIHVNNGPRKPAARYSGNVLGISVEDPDYDVLKGTYSGKAVITEILDVGGTGEKKRGQLAVAMPEVPKDGVDGRSALKASAKMPSGVYGT